MSAEMLPPDRPEESELVISFDPSGRNGKGRATVTLGSECLHADKLDPADSKDRRRFIRETCEKHPGIDQDDVAAKILGFVGHTVGRGGGHSRNGRAAVDAGEPDGRPAILIRTEEHEVADEAVAALANDPKPYQRGGMLVAVRRDPAPSKVITRPPEMPRITPLALPSIREAMTRQARWVKAREIKGGGIELVPAHVPEWVVSMVAARGVWSGVRHLEAVIEHPALLVNGAVLDRSGYDGPCGLLFVPNAPFPSIPESITREDAIRAAERLQDLVIDFPFAGPSHRAAWLAALLTPFARFAIAGPCPFFLFDASTPGTGKTLLVEIIALIVLGRMMARTAYPDSDEEMRKRITAIALAADPMILLDNIASTFGGPALDAALTGTVWRDRILGRSEMTGELPLNTIWFGTGNNTPLRGDVLRRISLSRLETSEERPEERQDFRHPDLKAHVLKNRAELVVAALTILRGFQLAGRPDQGLPTFGSYESWSATVRSAVHWAIEVDPWATREDLRTSDMETGTRAALVEGWAELPNSDLGVKVTEALSELRANPDRYHALRGALMEWSRTHDLPTARSIGMRLNALRGRVVNGKMLAAVDAGLNTRAWKVVPATQDGTRGTNGTSSPRSSLNTSNHTTCTECTYGENQNSRGVAGNSSISASSPIELEVFEV